MVTVPKWFDSQMVFPLATKLTATKRRRLELRTKEKIQEDIRKMGWDPIQSSFKTTWETPFQGTASMMGLPLEPKGIEE